MAYKLCTVADAIWHLNRDYYLPAIHHPYVETTDQIICLFDSLLKGYPIGSFIFWEVEPSQIDRLGIYKFVEDFKRDVFVSERADVKDQHLTLVLDGKQRLTCLLIGLRGSYKITLNAKLDQNPNSWEHLHLYLNLMVDASEDKFEPGARYGLSFFDDAPAEQIDVLWFPIRNIMQFDNENEFDEYVDSLLDSLEAKGVPHRTRRIVERNINKLYETIWINEAIPYFTEACCSLERALEILVRTNESCANFNKFDLLLK